MQEVHFFYIHHSLFTEGDKSSWIVSPPSISESTLQPLLTLFKLLKMNPFKKADFTQEELDTRKHKLNLQVRITCMTYSFVGGGPWRSPLASPISNRRTDG